MDLPQTRTVIPYKGIVFVYMIRFDVITIFPELFEAFSNESLLKRAQQKKLLKIQAHNLRAWAKDKHKKVDDKPFGGGLGMVMKVEPIYKAISTIKSKFQSPNFKINSKSKILKSKTILFTPRGKKFTQKMAHEFSGFDRLILICGRYEGIDERVAKYIADEKISVGDYVLMGGEVPAMAVIETVARLIPGVVGKPQFLKERQQKKAFVEYPQYTRPEAVQVTNNKQHIMAKVPKVLLSGDHKKIQEWRTKHGKVIE